MFIYINIWRWILRDLSRGGQGGSGYSVAQGSHRSINRCSGHGTTQEIRWRYRRKNPESIRTLQAVFISILVIFGSQNGPDLLVAQWCATSKSEPFWATKITKIKIKTAWRVGIDSGFFLLYRYHISWVVSWPEHRLIDLYEPCATLYPDPPTW